MKKYVICLTAVLAAIAGIHVAAAAQKNSQDLRINGHSDEYNQRLLNEFPLEFWNVPRSGINLKLPEIQYNLSDVFKPKASSIEVLGVFDAGGKPQAMIKIKNHSVESISFGDKLFNGDVTVTKIYVAKDSRRTSFITLEEDGILTSRLIGEKPVSESSR
jgi:hypothetical protein